MTSDRVCALSAEEEEHAALDYYDEDDDLEAFSNAELGCEDGGKSHGRRCTFALSQPPTAVFLYTVITRSIYGKHTASRDTVPRSTLCLLRTELHTHLNAI